MKKIVLGLILMFIGINTTLSQTQTIDVEITNIKSTKGKMIIALCDSQENFKTMKTMAYAFMFDVPNTGKMVCPIKIKPGKYSISVFHDENENKEVDMNFLGIIPKEPFGFSNNPSIMGRPEWNEIAIETKGIKKVSIKLYHL